MSVVKLYLSSYRIPVPGALFELLPKPPIECTVAIIPNAKDYKLPQERAQSLDELIYDITKFGFKTDVVDLREYDTADQLVPLLQGYDVIFAAGGNTFILRSELARSGLDEALPGLLESGIVYCGESAGAIVAGISLEGAEIGDDPDLADQKITRGLGLTQHVLVPHVGSAEYVEYINHIKQIYPSDQQVVYLNDSQAMVVDGAQQKIVTATG